MPELHLLRVFTSEDGGAGNPLAVFLDGDEVPDAERQRIAADLGLSETVFVDDARLGHVRIFTPATELAFAGHPLVGTAWLLARERSAVPTLRPPAGAVPVRVEDERAYAIGRPEWAPDFAHVELESPAAVDELSGPPEGHDLVGAWAWEDPDRGLVRVRVFPPRLGIEEDEATGAHAVRLCALLGRAIVIRQGAGSVIEARPAGDGRVEIGGRVGGLERRSYAPPGRAPGGAVESRPAPPALEAVAASTGVRASDGERERAIELLRDAAGDGRLTFEELADRVEAAGGAVMRAELDVLTADLPAPAAAATGRELVTGTRNSAVFGDLRRSGGWRVPARSRWDSVFGDVVLDLREAQVGEAEVKIDAGTVFGDVELLVPEGIVVEVRTWTLFGDVRQEAGEVAPAGAPRVVLSGWTIFGDVRVRARRLRERWAERLSRAGAERPRLRAPP